MISDGPCACYNVCRLSRRSSCKALNYFHLPRFRANNREKGGRTHRESSRKAHGLVKICSVLGDKSDQMPWWIESLALDQVAKQPPSSGTWKPPEAGDRMIEGDRKCTGNNRVGNSDVPRPIDVQPI